MDDLVPHRIAPTDGGDVAALWRKDGVAPPPSKIVRLMSRNFLTSFGYFQITLFTTLHINSCERLSNWRITRQSYIDHSDASYYQKHPKPNRNHHATKW